MPRSLLARRIAAAVPAAALFAVFARRYDDVFWLDAGDEAREGWSLFGHGMPDAVGPAETRIDTAPASDPALPPFSGGWVGWRDYESGARDAGAPVAPSSEAPAWLAVERAVAVDHVSGVLWALAPEEALTEWAAEIEALCTAASVPVVEPAPSRVATAGHDPDEYATLIERCREEIRAGRAYQLCLTTRFEVAGEHDAVQTYLRLRAATPAHHGGFVRIGDRALLSASPEVFLRVDGGRVETRPIKGTRPRGATAADDRALADELLASVKERAENVMIVDLMRNDLSRVCEAGSIRVDALWQVQSYPAVHQLVSTVSGRISHGTTVGDLWDAAFPAGSMTGAPKLSAMGILHDLERSARGVYSGCFGHVGLDGRLDLAMVIRSILLGPDGAVVGAGGGITWRSVAAEEVAEVATKARAPLAALGAAPPEAWRSE